MASSLNTSGSTTGGLINKISKGLGFNQNANYGISGMQSYSAPTPTGQPIQQGNNPGLLPKPDTTYTHVTSQNGSSKPMPNPNVLSQQKMLNEKYGAGLVEDGLAGPKTAAAIAKFMTKGDTTPPAPAPTPAPQPTTPQVGNQIQNAQNVLNAGGQTDWEKAAAENVANAKGMQNFGQFAPFAEAPFYAGSDEKTMREGLITRPDLVGRAGAETDLFNRFANLYGTQANVGLQAAQEAARRGLQGAETVLGAGAPQLGTPGQVSFNPLTGNQGNILGSQGGGNGLLVAGNLAQLPALQEAYTTMSNNMGAISGIENLLSTKLGGSQNLSDINKVNQAINAIKGNTSSPEYNTFKTLLASLGQLYSAYFSGSGQETDATRAIGQSLIDGTASASTIKAVLDTLKSEAGVRLNQLYSNIQNISSNPSYLPSPNVGGSSGGSTGGSFAEQW